MNLLGLYPYAWPPAFTVPPRFSGYAVQVGDAGAWGLLECSALKASQLMEARGD